MRDGNNTLNDDSGVHPPPRRDRPTMRGPQNKRLMSLALNRSDNKRLATLKLVRE